MRPNTLNKEYGLTTTEVRIALAIAKGMSVKDIAELNGTTQNTVRSQLKAVFRKTGVHRQAVLVKLLLAG